MTIVPKKTTHILDTLGETTPHWTEIMERIGSEIPKQSKDKKKRKFSYAKFRKMLKYNSSGKCENAFQLATSPEFLRLSYDFIKSKPGNMVRGSDQLTLDGIPRTWFEDTSKLLCEEKYVFKRPVPPAERGG